MKKIPLTFTQIFLLLSGVIAFSYLIGESLGFVNAQSLSEEQLENFIPKFSEISGNDFMQNLLDTTGGAKICPKTKNEEICQPMLGKDCAENCDVECLDGAFLDLPLNSECKLGTCFDEKEGICQTRSPKERCEEDSGKWFDDETGNIDICQKKCCVLGNQALFVTKRHCENIAETLGLNFGSDINVEEVSSELECLAKANSQEEGACIIESEAEKNCRFITNSNCIELSGMFYPNTLCSNEDLETICEKQNSTACVDGLDEVYWFDSCGNRENIFEGNSKTKRELSWNDGFVKSKEESCNLGANDSPLTNQKDCGNCNRLKGSICGEETEGQELNDAPDSGAVCLDMGCIDEQGKRREHGESWCAYQSQIGLAGIDTGALDILRGIIPSNPLTDLIAGDKSVDTPGSQHFRKSCLNGKIETETCGNYRNEICVEERTEIAETEREFSQASCRLNRWQECLAYNPSQSEGRIIGMAGESAGKILKAKLEATCGLDPDCFVKDVNVDKGFQFSYCAPRYPPGFDMKGNPEAAEQICAQASQTCTVIYVKKLSGWECEANCDCEEEKFAHQMNEFCISLGDCGATVNYIGSPGVGGYSVSEDGKSNLGWISNFNPSVLLDTVYASPIPGEYIGANSEVIEGVRGSWLSDIFEGLNVGNILANSNSRPTLPKGNAAEAGTNLGLVSGGIGTGAVAAAYLTPTVVGFHSAGFFGVIPIVGANPSLLGFGGAAIGAAVGAAVVGFLIDVLGISPGIGSAATYVLIGAGAFGAGLMGLSVIATESLVGACNNPVGCVIVVVVIITEVLLTLFGIGDIDEREIRFECKPWIPPIQGDCESCGTDKLSDGGEKFPCNKYSCETLGQNCEFVSNTEGPEGGSCIPVEKTDVSSPRIISLNEEILTEGFEYFDFSESGFKIKRKRGNDCISQFEPLTFGFSLDEYGRCSISGERKEKFEEMTLIGRLAMNQSFGFNSLDISDMGTELSSEDITEVELYLACEDYLGNSNINNPYSVGFCVDPDDWTPPVLSSAESYVLPYDTIEAELVVYVSEPADLRWSFSDLEFEEMENELECNFNFRTVRGFECHAMIPVDADREEVHIRARDHPEWAGTEDETNRNENQESILVVIKRSETGLQIDSIKPDNEIIIDSVPVKSVNVEAETSGGLNGKAECLIEIDGRGLGIMQTTGSSLHKQTLTAIVEGEHRIEISCKDEAGNSAEKEARFSYQRKSTTPQIGRVYSQGGSLFVVTNEKAECSYKNTGCNFAVAQGKSMESSSDKLTHFALFEQDKTYYIKCKDEFGNEKTQCDIIVSGGLF